MSFVWRRQDIYQWCGSECNRYEKLKASHVAIHIRDNERNGRANLHMEDEGQEPQAFTEVTDGGAQRNAPFGFLSHALETQRRSCCPASRSSGVVAMRVTSGSVGTNAHNAGVCNELPAGQIGANSRPCKHLKGGRSSPQKTNERIHKGQILPPPIIV